MNLFHAYRSWNLFLPPTTIDADREESKDQETLYRQIIMKAKEIRGRDQEHVREYPVIPPLSGRR